MAFIVLLLALAVIKQCCLTAGAPFWIGGELPVFVIRPHAPNREVRTVMVRYEYMYRATPIVYMCALSFSGSVGDHVPVLCSHYCYYPVL